MTASGSFTCPACGAEFDVRERLEESQRPEPVADQPRAEAAPEPPSEPPSEPVSFQCPACGADYETEERLGDETVTEPRGSPR